MLKRHMAACLVASAFLTMPVLAQTSGTQPSGAQPSASQPSASQPSATQPSSPASPSGSATMSPSGSSGSQAASASSGQSGQFVQQQQQNQWRASKLIGVDVYGSDNEKIGDVNEVLVDRNGNAEIVVVGVGGFLGIGEKNVGIPFKSIEWKTEPRRTAAAGTGTAPAGRTDGAATTGTTGTAGTAGTARDTTATGSTAGTARTDTSVPDHAMVRMSKADLQNAPSFAYAGETRSDDRSGARSTTAPGGTTAPRQ
jgi:sporulation protein YlmC with PRC-barrel domain